MSADRISECPRCHAWELREYVDVGINKDGIFFDDYDCKCHACDFEWESKREFHIDSKLRKFKTETEYTLNGIVITKTIYGNNEHFSFRLRNNNKAEYVNINSVSDVQDIIKVLQSVLDDLEKGVKDV